jgi:nucleoid DNA-binding protein
MYIFGGIFFVLFLIDLFIAIATNAFDCTEQTFCVIKEEYLFVRLSLYPIAIGTIIFIVLGRIFFGLAHRQSDLLSASEYKRTLDFNQNQSSQFEKSQLSEKFRTVEDKKETNLFGDLISKWKDQLQNKKKIRDEKKTAKNKLKEVRKQELERLKHESLEQTKQEELLKARRKLNKTELIILLSETTKLSQNETRKFINAFTDVIKDTVNNEDIKISGFGRFYKEAIEEENGEVENTVTFAPYKMLLDSLNVFETEQEEDEIVEELNSTTEVNEANDEIEETTSQIDNESIDDLQDIPNEEEESEIAKEEVENKEESITIEKPVKEEMVEEVLEFEDENKEPAKEEMSEEVLESEDENEEPNENQELQDDLGNLPKEDTTPKQKPIKSVSKKKKIVTKTKKDIIELMGESQ